MSARAAVRRPSSICAQNGESAGRIARCEGPDLVLPSWDSAAAVVWAVAGRSGSSPASCPGLVTRLLSAGKVRVERRRTAPRVDAQLCAADAL